jgi:hypothetical protein
MTWFVAAWVLLGLSKLAKSGLLTRQQHFLPCGGHVLLDPETVCYLNYDQ